MRDHTKLRAFQLADECVLGIYTITRAFPREEVYGLTAQMRRCAVSVASNIVEGCGRNSQDEYLRFLEIAYASCRELEYQLGLSVRLGYVSANEAAQSLSRVQETAKVLGALIRSFRAPRPSQPPLPPA